MQTGVKCSVQPETCGSKPCHDVVFSGTFPLWFPSLPLSTSSASPQATLPFASTLWHSSAPGNEGDQIRIGTLTPMTPFSSVANSSFSQSVALFASSFSETLSLPAYISSSLLPLSCSQFNQIGWISVAEWFNRYRRHQRERKSIASPSFPLSFQPFLSISVLRSQHPLRHHYLLKVIQLFLPILNVAFD